MNPVLVGRHEQFIGRTRGEERTRVRADAQQAHRGVDRGEVERRSVGQRRRREIV